jgi:hypothetical protein
VENEKNKNSLDWESATEGVKAGAKQVGWKRREVRARRDDGQVCHGHA